METFLHGMVLTNLATVFFTSNYRSVPVSYTSDSLYIQDYLPSFPLDLSIGVPYVVDFLIAVSVTCCALSSRVRASNTARAASLEPFQATSTR